VSGADRPIPPIRGLPRHRRIPLCGATALSLAAIWLTAAPGGAQDSGAPPGPAALAQQGALFYQREGCPICHRIGGTGGIAGPALDGVATRRPDPAWYVGFLRDPASVKKDAPMPPFGHLPEAQLRAIAAYLLTLK
jgi:mono/diheme cytochrome c family protein